jgi:hypothetical protein
VIVELVPVPVVVVPPGVQVNVQVPVAGRPFNTTLPVAEAQVGCVMVPTVGAVGAPATEFITTFAEEAETQVEEFVTVYV